jgi:hypothetical protein
MDLLNGFQKQDFSAKMMKPGARFGSALDEDFSMMLIFQVARLFSAWAGLET